MYEDSCFVVEGTTPCDRVATIRNFYLYLWGLPMKLKDPGTNIVAQVKDTVVNDEDVFGITVPYAKDVWTFYFRKSDYSLNAYQFMFSEKPGGEIILLEGEHVTSGIKFPKTRAWYQLPGNDYLGKDILTAIK
ncbi:DUF6503 family protein [Marinoscillum furvescens]|uniref:Uncharacterized protein n=1 Tax=Marinoscillum furvescens DSM 4134 TaxID=1122208 RepID=A0A3D9L0Y3_MARFU|nr:DUF6503 family protein [Marinoscillum furvescens]RED97412.1 hypothetical protein C7460_11221 [Marinoscillum furvescens DSM 4134]